MTKMKWNGDAWVTYWEGLYRGQQPIANVVRTTIVMTKGVAKCHPLLFQLPSRQRVTSVNACLVEV